MLINVRLAAHLGSPLLRQGAPQPCRPDKWEAPDLPGFTHGTARTSFRLVITASGVCIGYRPVATRSSDEREELRRVRRVNRMPRKEREFAKKGRCLPPLTSGRSRIPAPRGAREAVMAEGHGSRTHPRHVAMPPNGF